MAVTALFASAAAAQERTRIRIVGSSTVFPFATAVAERFGRSTDHPTPVVEATGSGGGLKLFCAGVGADTPDIANASRRVKMSEFEACRSNGVAMTEIVAGRDGIVVANARSGPDYDLSRAQLWKALARTGPKPESWDEIEPVLPMEKIEVLGPPPTSGTRDAFEALVMAPGCEQAGGEDCHGEGMEIREDGPYVEAGENDNLIVSKLEANDRALGIFGFSSLDRNTDAIRGAAIDGVAPTFDTIASGAYPVSRPLFFYIKKNHVGVVPGIREYAREFVSAEGAGGTLVDLGLVPVDEKTREKNRQAVEELPAMTAGAF